MDEKKLLTIALFAALIGIFILYLLSESLDYNENSIEKINQEKLKDMMKVKGTISQATNLDNVSFITIEQPATLTIVLFDNLSVSKGEEIEVIGQSEEYEGEMEIIAQRIRVIIVSGPSPRPGNVT